MPRKFLLLIFLVISLNTKAQKANWPDSIFSGKQGTMHVQGIAVDKAKGHIYFSFTDKLVKMDLNGKLIGSVTGFIGHLGDLDITDDGKIYGSLEYKNDAIGKGIKKQLGVDGANQDGFYIAIFEGAGIIRPDMDAEKEDLVRAVYLPEVLKDYTAEVKTGDKILPHRFACSGIDGVAFAPAIGGKSTTKKYLYVAYGIYGDTTRTDNDYQVILKYDTQNWDKYAKPLSQNKLHKSGPAMPMDKYFVKTGNTRYGIQNLAYDNTTGNLFAAVYHGSKLQYPNYDLFVIDGNKPPVETMLKSGELPIKVKTLSLAKGGLVNGRSGINGWYFPWGATGLCPLGDGLFYISHNQKSKDGQQQSTAHLYKWTADTKNPFVLAK